MPVSEVQASNVIKSNGVITDSALPKGTAVNRRKQKRRQKQASRNSASGQDQPASSLDYGVDDDYPNGQTAPEHGYSLPSERQPGMQDANYDDQYLSSNTALAPEDDQNDYSEDESSYPQDQTQVISHAAQGTSKRKKSKKKARSKAQLNGHHEHPDMSSGPYADPPPPPPPPPPISHDALNTVRHNFNRDGIWNTSSQEERLRIKEFWLDLPEDDRKSLVRIEKEAVLRKMKEQQKHSCSCTVCGRKRTAIEEELEVLYDAYYEELEQFANHNQAAAENGGPILPHPHQHTHASLYGPSGFQRSRGRIHEIEHEDEAEEAFSDEAEIDEDEYDEEYDDLDEDDFSGASTNEMRTTATATDFFTFGNSLTVKGGILTVADDLLKNDGQKFIDMMEQLAERRMQREEDAQHGTYRTAHSSSMPPATHADQAYGPGDPDDPYDEADDYDSQDEEEEELDNEEEDEMDTMTEAQRMEEGRRMFQIFAARMFEQRVLTAYREKVATERQQRLIEELAAEEDQKTLKDEKRQRDAEKKKAKKLQQKQEKDRKKAAKDAEKAAEEAAAREAEEMRQAELKKRRDEAKRKKEEQKRAQDEEKQRKEAEKQRRQTMERERQQELERKAREEKKRKEDLKKKERDEREAAEKAARDKKAQEDREVRFKDESARPQANGNTATTSLPPHDQTVGGAETARRPPAMVALPPGMRSQRAASSAQSPQAKPAAPSTVATAPPAAQPRDKSSSISQASTPQTQEPTAAHNKQSTPPKLPPATRSQATSNAASRASSHQFSTQQSPASPSVMMPPPGVSTGMSQVTPGQFPGMAGFHGAPQGQAMLHGLGNRSAMGPPPQSLHIPPPPQPRTMHMFPPGPNHAIGAPGFAPGGRSFPTEPPPGFASHMTSPMSSSPHTAFSHGRDGIAAHSRQQSMSQDITPIEPPSMNMHAAGRPVPIKRPASVKPGDQRRGIELGEQLGSSALLDDSEEADLTEPLRSMPTPAQGFGGSPFDQPGSMFTPTTRAASNHHWGPPPPGSNGVGLGWGNSAGWTHAGSLPSPSRKNLLAMRILTCNACQTLSLKRPGFHSADEVLGWVNANRQLTDDQYTFDDLTNIVDTEGDRQNGGGFFQTEHDAQRRLLVKWQSEGSSGLREGIGQIGSPVIAPMHMHMGRGF